ncbi:dephospho-CoA kinase [Bifidobacterium aesculapii]|uniref:dephospho-CoA kinase n=1 Tax=Bifidobacterium aesculapii TaxID=1329411 RepID=UPI0006E3A974|nr:dephospho-CoA kinase [Bifidobacterium aesculapii]
MIRVGLTGGIAAGKSTVAARLGELGALHIDYDALARAVVAPGGTALHAIEREFGPHALKPDGTLDREWVAGHVFGAAAAPGARDRLDAIEHPLIYAAAAHVEREHPEARVIVHDVPLLAEVIGTMPFRFDHIVTVEAPAQMRIARMTATRGMTREQAEARIRSQSTRAEREAIADTVVDSTVPLEQMFEQVDRLYARWIEAAKSA